MIIKINYIHNTKNARMFDYGNGMYKVVYNTWFGDDQYGMEFVNMIDAEEMFNFINMAGITAEELENLGFEI